MESNSKVQRSVNKELWAATEFGETENVRALLDAGADPRAYNSCALWIAATHGYTEIVGLLLDDGRANPAADESRALAAAVENGHADIVRALLDDGRADPATQNSNALSTAARHRNVAIVRLLLQDGRADPAAEDSYALLCAANASKEILRELLKDGRADPVAASRDVGLEAAARFGDLDAICLMLAAMPPSARLQVVNDLKQHIPWPKIGRPVLEFLLQYNDATSRVLDIVQVLLKSDIPTQSLFALAQEAARRNMTPEAVLVLHEQGNLGSILRNRLGPTAEFPSVAAIEQLSDLRALASVSKAEPMLQMGAGHLDLVQYPAVLEALAPMLPARVRTSMWQTLRANARGEEPARAYGTPAQRMRDRMASSVLLDSAVTAYNAFVADVKNVTNHKDPLLSAAANHCLRALNALSNAMQRADAGALAKAQAQVETKLETYEERVTKVLGEADIKRAQRFALVRSIVRMPAPQLAEFARAQSRERTSRTVQILF